MSESMPPPATDDDVRHNREVWRADPDAQAKALHRLLADYASPDPSLVSKLPKGKEDKTKRKACRACGGYHDPSMFHLDYVGHADVTRILLQVDPLWCWQAAGRDQIGRPAFDRTAPDATPHGLWITLTVCGVTRPGYGSVDDNKIDAEKELIGDALRNAAMRFGVGLDLWSKSDAASASPPAPAAQPQPDKQAEPKRNAQQEAVKIAFSDLDTAEQEKVKAAWVEAGYPRDFTKLSDDACKAVLDWIDAAGKPVDEGSVPF